MRRGRSRSRGLAEIVGTLMLVVIVVAAATAFAFFVASYQKQVQAEEIATHDRALEKVKVVGLTASGCSSCADPPMGDEYGQIAIEVASLDPNPIGISGILLNGHAVVNYSVVIGTNVTTPCFSFNSTSGAESTGSCVPARIPAFSEPEFLFDLDNSTPFNGSHGTCYSGGYLNLGRCAYAFGLPYVSPAFSPSHSVEFDLVTTLGNSFTSSFIPPIPIVEITYVNDYPILDGANSYQPSGGTTTNASISSWAWTVQQHDGGFLGAAENYYGQSVQIPPFSPGGSYWITLEVTNSYGLTGIVNESYTTPGHLTYVNVTFTESGLSATQWTVTLGGVTTSSTGLSINFTSVPNGTYRFSISSSMSPKLPSPATGLILLEGRDYAQLVTFQ